jgi:hypothetical protein
MGGCSQMEPGWRTDACSCLEWWQDNQDNAGKPHGSSSRSCQHAGSAALGGTARARHNPCSRQRKSDYGRAQRANPGGERTNCSQPESPSRETSCPHGQSPLNGQSPLTARPKVSLAPAQDSGWRHRLHVRPRGHPSPLGIPSVERILKSVSAAPRQGFSQAAPSPARDSPFRTVCCSGPITLQPDATTCALRDNVPRPVRFLPQVLKPHASRKFPCHARRGHYDKVSSESRLNRAFSIVIRFDCSFLLSFCPNGFFPREIAQW